MSFISKTFISNRTFASVKDYKVTGDGVTDDSATLQTVFTSVDDAIYPPGTYLINSDITLGEIGDSHHFHVGAMIKPGTGKTVTIYGEIDADDSQIFDLSGGGSISLPNILNVHAAWFGAIADGITDCAISIQLALDSIDSGTVHFAPGTYAISTSLSGTTKSLAIGRGTKIKPTNADLDINAFIDADDDIEILNLSSGTVKLKRNSSVSCVWFGADGRGGGHYDSDGLQAAIDMFQDIGNGGEIVIPNNIIGPLLLDKQVLIGSPAGIGDGITIRCTNPTYGLPNMYAAVSFPAGHAMIRSTNTIRFRCIGLDMDGNGLADYCGQTQATLGGYPGWHAQWIECTFRNARIHNVISGEIQLEPTVSGAVFTATGHELQNDAVVYLWKELETAVVPSGFIEDSIYYVVQRATNTFKLSASLGGSPITASDSGVGRWLVCKLSTGDCSGTQFNECSFVNGTTGNPISHFAQSGTNTLSSGFLDCIFAGNFIYAGGITYTANSSTDFITPASGTWTNGTGFLVWRQASTDVLATGTGFNEDTELWMVNSTGSTFKAATYKGGPAINITANGSGTQKFAPLAYPLYGINAHGGGVSARGCLGGSLYQDVLVTGGPIGGGDDSGTMLSLFHWHSQSFRLLRVAKRGLSFAPQIGGITLEGCTHSDIFGGCRNSIYYNYAAYASLTVTGGSLTGNINVTGSSSVEVQNVQFIPHGADAGFQGTVTGDLSLVSGVWQENASQTGRQARTQVGDAVRGIGTTLFLGLTDQVPTIGRTDLNLLGLQSLASIFAFIRPALGQEAIFIDVGFDTSGSPPSGSGLLGLRAKAGTGTAGIYYDADQHTWRTAGSNFDYLKLTTPATASAQFDSGNQIILIPVGGLEVWTGLGPTKYFEVDASGNVKAGSDQSKISRGPESQLIAGPVALGALGVHDYTLAVAGAVFGTDIVVASPVTTPDANLIWCAWVSATNQITLRITALTAFTTTSTTYNIKIVKL